MISPERMEEMAFEELFNEYKKLRKKLAHSKEIIKKLKEELKIKNKILKDIKGA